MLVRDEGGRWVHQPTKISIPARKCQGCGAQERIKPFDGTVMIAARAGAYRCPKCSFRKEDEEIIFLSEKNRREYLGSEKNFEQTGVISCHKLA